MSSDVTERGVFGRLVGQHDVEQSLRAAALSARGDSSGSDMTHAWLFTGPPGSGRSVAALCFAAALQCTSDGEPGCGQCHACTTTMAGTHGDVRRIIPDGLSISVKGMREIVNIASRRPTTGRWQVIVVEDADRLTEGAANALLKVVEEPPDRTVILLCAPTTDPEDMSVTLRSRCRHLALVTPSVESIAQVLIGRDGLAPDQARFAASISGGHVGRARRLATDDVARDERARSLRLAFDAASASTAYKAAENLVKSIESETKTLFTDVKERELEELKVSLGGGGTGKGTAGTLRGSAGLIKELEARQKSRDTRAKRDLLDRTLIDLAGMYRDALSYALGSSSTSTHPDMAERASDLASRTSPEGLLKCIEAVLACREAVDFNVKLQWALDAMVASIGEAFRPPFSRSGG
ncbi:DNA polymerase III subunit delta' [Rhodococcus sp. ACPA4]|jgi:DNA polymerase-3 subunit delta'|uniref:DNA polymerase III subunit delta' n=2 Tax=Nocardiaceae TaxID=85025 RepID=A0A652YQ08_NOCGL|nr:MULTISPECIES: DNA polymerase III subunit delta' [Rhodococcus]NMD62570.1 DNA polymerase III subunit delta' [Nocardia globerula]KJF25379.1 DNA polymerase III subunit tau [Rhodococcus sp. AD45]MDV6271369.1 DNA polymerase III subunit delta' [Rhodococcus globerulus]NRI70093.1 DNA polymerase III subunit delta' [Rhodococcus sp. MS16]PBC44122.1 DNA polymerase III subunit delta' [Rhodococcus sp. ACPA4]